VHHNGARVLARGTTERDGDVLRRTFQMSLVEGENRIKATAACSDGSWESEPAEIVLRYEKPVEKSRLYLLAVGISSYANATLNLDYAANDARTLAHVFRQRGTPLYENVHAYSLVDEKATRSTIVRALEAIAAKPQPQDTLVVFLAGHGTMVGQRYYFVPHDIRREAENLVDDIRKQGLPADEISDYVGATKALKRVLIYDTCASGGALPMHSKSRSGFALRGSVERLSRTHGMCVITAAAATEEAKESRELGHGVLSYTLLAGLNAVDRGPLAGRHVQPMSADRVVDVTEWTAYAQSQVPQLTQRLFGAAQDVECSNTGVGFPLLPLEN